MIAGQVSEDQHDRREPTIIDARGIRPPAAFTIADGHSSGPVRIIELSGELDLAAAPQLRARIDETEPGQTLVLDLAKTTFIDSATLKELLRARAELASRDARVVLAGVPPPVRRLLDLTRTSELFDDAPDVETALKQLG
jgi:anti-sigma B factor antagonist